MYQDVALADTSVLQLLSLGKQGPSLAIAQPPAWPDGWSMAARVTSTECARPTYNHLNRTSADQYFSS